MALARSVDPQDETTALPPEEPAGELGAVGPYRLLAVLGEGGMGTVYLAEQREPIHRRVALKLVRAGLAGKEVLARFEAERQALALMTHPGIARVLDAGTTVDGAPYFVMEYVHGEPINAYCDKKRLSTGERLELFREACAAVQHAHQRGILHRDLKPSNILVEEVDGTPRPKVIDFGLAKALNQRLTERTLFTERGAIVGTPEYMSPEQAAGEAFDVDTTTDVYSLGVVLYELLTGSLPHDPQKLREAGWLGMMKMLREEEPKKASTQVSTFNEERASAVAGQRRTEPKSLRRSLQGDLDWILLKALDKERERRYPSVSDLAADLGRHLGNEPVIARPPSPVYRARKFVRRHSLGVAASGVFILIFSVGVGVSTALFLRARDVQQRAQEESRRAEIAIYFQFPIPFDSLDRLNVEISRFLVKRAADHFEESLELERCAGLSQLDLAQAAIQRFRFIYALKCRVDLGQRCSSDDRAFLEPFFARTLSGILPVLGRQPAYNFADLFHPFARKAWRNGLDPSGQSMLPILRASAVLRPGTKSARSLASLRSSWGALIQILTANSETNMVQQHHSEAETLAQEAVSVSRQRRESPRPESPSALIQFDDALGPVLDNYNGFDGDDVRAYLLLARLRSEAGDHRGAESLLREAETLLASTRASEDRFAALESEARTIRSIRP